MRGAPFRNWRKSRQFPGAGRDRLPERPARQRRDQLEENSALHLGLVVTWSDGTASAVNLAGWIARGSPRIAPFRDLAVFARAGLGLHGSNVTWEGDEGDLAINAEHLRMIAEHQAPFVAADVTAWQAEMGVSNAETADLVGIVLSTWSSYRAGATVPATVARLCRAMLADLVILSAHLRPRAADMPKWVVSSSLWRRPTF